MSYKKPPLKPVKVCDPFCFISGISAQIIPSWATQTISAQSRISVLMFTSASTTWWAFHALYGEPTKNPQQFGDVGPFHGLRASGFLWPYSRISSYSSRANLFLAAMLGSHGINGHQGYQQDFSTPAWDHILKTPHLMKQNNNIDQYWCCCFICFHSEVDQAAIIDPGSPSPSICWSTEIPGVKRVALHLRQTLGTPTSTLHTFIMIFRISMFT